MPETSKKHAVIIGGGLVGPLCALFLAKRGYKVDLYEKREDTRKSKISKGRSINLSLSYRGRKALKHLGLEEKILKNCEAMKGRFLHSINGKTKSILYDSVYNNCIYSVGRNVLNTTLLEETKKYSNVRLHFNTKLLKVNFNSESITLQNTQTSETFEVRADFFIGADGAYSTLRRSMEITPLFQFSQTYIEHGYLELRVPPEKGDLLQSNHLHIWPRGEFMMISLPNSDSSWTVTLFMPFAKFEALENKEKLLKFFQETFPDALPLIGEKEIVETFFKSVPSALLSIKCGRYYHGNKFMIIGDAGHAMVPFYGQGMNSGFEDCTILNEILDSFDDNISESIREFSTARRDDANAICDLAMYNYLEMRDLVEKRSFLMRKFVDELVFKMFPRFWVPLYNSVSFSDMKYSRCVQNRKWQDQVLKFPLYCIFVLLTSIILNSFMEVVQ